MADNYQRLISKPTVFVVRIVLFLTLAALLGVMLYEPIQRSFLSNPLLNGLIGFVLLIGIVYTLSQIFKLSREIQWVNNYRYSEPGKVSSKPPILLAPMASLLRDKAGHISLSTSATASLMDTIGNRLDESRGTSRYLVGLLVFLGLLGTFWGLLETINSVGKTINALGGNGGSGGLIFDELKTGLAAPLKGMGTAFSSSLFGLSGSLILGFLDLQAAQAQNRFYNDLEEWLTGITELSMGQTPIDTRSGDVNTQIAYTLQELQHNLSMMAQRMEMNQHKSMQADETVKEIATNLQEIAMQMRQEQQIVRSWMDDQAKQQNAVTAALQAIADKKNS